MIRVFGLIVALAALIAPAQAALLTYGFANTAVGVVDPVSAGTAANFAGSGFVDATKWNTAGLGTTRLNNFSFTASGSSPGIAIKDLVVNARRGTATSPNGAQIEVFYNIGATSTGVSGTSLGFNTLSSTATPFASDINVQLSAGQTIHFTIRSSRTGTYAGTAMFEDITLNGDLVPEPTSMAVFGLLGAGIAARRIRRKV